MNSGNLQVDRAGNRIRIAGVLVLRSFRRVLAAIHQATHDEGLTDVTLDLSSTTYAAPGPMLAVLAACDRLRDETDVNFSLIRPTEGVVRRLFSNANWAHLLAPSRFPRSTWNPTDVMPARRFTSPDEQGGIVNGILDAMLSSGAGLSRESLWAFEWAINEITDNVLQHANCPQGGLVQLSQYSGRQEVEFVVADAGRGIPTTMRTARTEISDAEALTLSIERGITRDNDAGQGNGLFGTQRAARVGTGRFAIHSGYASVGSDFDARMEATPVGGTLVVVRLDYSDPHALWRAIPALDGLRELSGDYVENRYEHETDDVLHFVVKQEADSVGSRSAGRLVRSKLQSLMSMYPNYPVHVDFDGIAVISSSFADEFLGKLFVRIGALRFMNTIHLRGVSPAVRSLLDQAIFQRVRQETDEE